MKGKQHFRAILAEARQRIAERAFAQARALLESVRRDPESDVLGPLTMLGLPRPLHAALLKLAKAEGDELRRIGYQYTLVPPPALMEPYGRFSDRDRARMAEAGRAAVPRLIHQIWIGPQPPPHTTDAWRIHAAQRGYDYRLWREKDLAGAGVDRHPAFAAMAARGDLPGAVDVARYMILQKMGGIYLDCDWYPARHDITFHDRLPLIGIAVVAEKVPRDLGAGSLLLSNAFIAAPPGHPVFARMLEVMPEVLRAMPDAPAWWSTGPLLFTLICRGAAVAIADSGLLAGSAAPDADDDHIRALCAAARAANGGLLLAWKPWQAGAA